MPSGIAPYVCFFANNIWRAVSSCDGGIRCAFPPYSAMVLCCYFGLLLLKTGQVAAQWSPKYIDIRDRLYNLA